MKKNMLKNIEWTILICSILLVVIGCIALYSATFEIGKQDFNKQVIWAIICIPVVIIVTIMDYEILAKISPFLFGVIIVLLIGVLFTTPINGARSWYNLGALSFQPGEAAKIITILFLSYIVSKVQSKDRDNISNPLYILLFIGIVAIPASLIISQPDIGTAIPFVIALIFILFAGGIKKRYIIISFLIIASCITILATNQDLYEKIMPAHARARIETYLHPELDPRGAGYNVLQSKLAIGSGQLVGMGVLKGNQTQLGYLHPKTTDFIYSVIGEEMGFIAAGSVIIIYIILITKGIYVAKTAKDPVGSYIATGIVAVFMFHMLENIGMTMGILPITGIPLPFISYGGTSLLTNFICVGLLLSISARRKKVLFTS